MAEISTMIIWWQVVIIANMSSLRLTNLKEGQTRGGIIAKYSKAARKSTCEKSVLDETIVTR